MAKRIGTEAISPAVDQSSRQRESSELEQEAVGATRIDAAENLVAPHLTGDESPAERTAAEPPSVDCESFAARGDVAEIGDVDDGELLRNQARRLALHLREKQEELDRREAEWQVQLARHDNERRAAQVWHRRRLDELAEREADFQMREESYRLREAAYAAREEELAAEAERLREGEAGAAMLLEQDRALLAAERAELEARCEKVRAREEELERLNMEAALETAARRHAAAEVEARRAELQGEIETLRTRYEEMESRREELEKLANEPSRFQLDLQIALNEREATLDVREAAIVEQETTLKHAMLEWERLRAELTEERERLAAQQRHDRLELAELRRRAEAEDADRRQALERQSEQLDFRRAAIRREQEELSAAQRETLEMRLAAEELWTQLSGTMPAAALAEQMARIRSKLSEQYRLLQADLTAQKAELDSLRNDLSIEAERLRFQTQELHRWAEARHEDIERQAAYLTGREAELERQDAALFQRNQAWRQERFQLEQEIRRLKAERRQATA